MSNRTPIHHGTHADGWTAITRFARFAGTVACADVWVVRACGAWHAHCPIGAIVLRQHDVVTGAVITRGAVLALTH